jgi:hypothetical protein
LFGCLSFGFHVWQLFGVSSIEDLLGTYTFPYLEGSDLNIRVNAIIDQLRKNKGGAYGPVIVAVEGYSFLFFAQIWSFKTETQF